jgi:MoxR-like ATPase
MATQNPIEQEGTYPLPEAQVDRFMLKILIDYPDKAEEKEIMKRVGFDAPETVVPVSRTLLEISAVGRIDQPRLHGRKTQRLHCGPGFCHAQSGGLQHVDVADYIQFGASPRATIFLSLVARAHAFLQGRAYVTPQDVKTIAPAVLRHRILLTYEAEAEDVDTDQIIGRIFDSVEVP